MPRKLSQLAVAVAAWLMMPAAASAQAAAPQGPAGMTIETAIMLPNIADEFHGVAAEHAYIAAHFPTWHIVNQATMEENGRRYDLIGMTRPNNTPTTLYFDITDWFGK
jgi:hypothetical protein